MTYTEKELDQFLHGISLSLLSKKSAQHWRYDEETAKEIEWLEVLERKVRADKADRKTEPTISKMEQVDKDINVRSKDETRLTAKCLNCANGSSYKCSKCDGEMYYKYDKDEPQTETEIAKAIVHKMIDDAVIAEDAYPDLRQRMHDAVERMDEPQTDCNKLINEVVKLDMSREDKFKVMELLERHCEKCKHYLFTDIDGHYCEHETYGQPCQYAPKDEPQTDCSWR